MASLWQIDQAIQEFLDGLYNTVDENGEVIEPDFEQLEALNVERKAKMENLALYIKNTLAEAAAVKAEADALDERRKKLEKKAESLNKYMALSMLKNKEPELSSPRFVAKYKESISTEVYDEAALPDEFLKPQKPKPDKTAIKAAINAGQEVAGARLVTKQYVNLK